ncbi:unnamed protein product [Lupinus luteus]|uniref:Uncharacterized protein n=1 Tax=Lupinus luteus TaxID=3873 RepID=A0AAV1WP52_LUPLU
MQAIQVWHLEKTKKVIVELNGYERGNDNGSNLLVRFLALQEKILLATHVVVVMKNDNEVRSIPVVNGAVALVNDVVAEWLRSPSSNWNHIIFYHRCLNACTVSLIFLLALLLDLGSLHFGLQLMNTDNFMITEQNGILMPN